MTRNSLKQLLETFISEGPIAFSGILFSNNAEFNAVSSQE